MQWSAKPVILLGAGARGADMHILLSLGIPILTSWQAKDMIDNDHPLYFGSPGQYGQRIANKVMYEADMILAIGNRLSIWCAGYEGPRADQRLVMVDIDPLEPRKFRHAEWIDQDATEFVREIPLPPDIEQWRDICFSWRAGFPLVESPAHDDTGGRINSYRFMEALQPFLRHDEVIVTDMGTALISAHQVLRLKPPQRIMTSGGLGEMGCALPAAIGASFARDKGEVLCLHCDGGFMMNLQELATIAHHNLPIKIIVFENDGYGMIRETQDKAGQRHVATDKASGITLPSFRRVASAFGIESCDVYTWAHFHTAIPQLFHSPRAGLVEVHMDPAQKMVPKLDPIYRDGRVVSPRFCDMSPPICQ